MVLKFNLRIFISIFLMGLYKGRNQFCKNVVQV